MDIIVPMKHVPDLVEELEIAQDGTRLDPNSLKLKVNEFDEHALEEAILLKEAQGGTVTVIALDADGVDDTLCTALAKGTDRALKVTGDFADGVSSHTAAAILGEVIKGMPHDVILTGVQSAEDRDGQVGPLLACVLGIPHVSVVTGVKIEGQVATIHQEYAGGVLGEMEVDLPAVFGVQAAKKPPRYVPVSKVRQAMKTAKIETIEAPAVAEGAVVGGRVIRMFKPESGSRATMLEGSPEEQVDRLLAILKERGLTK